MDRDQMDLRRLLWFRASGPHHHFFIDWSIHTYISIYGNEDNPPARLARLIITQNAIAPAYSCPFAYVHNWQSARSHAAKDVSPSQNDGPSPGTFRPKVAVG